MTDPVKTAAELTGKEYDLIVVGSGAAGLTAAVTAQLHGLQVLLLEGTDKIGGSTAYSGGFHWLPNNHLIHAAGLSDSETEALKYCASAPGCELDSERIASF